MFYKSLHGDFIAVVRFYTLPQFCLEKSVIFVNCIFELILQDFLFYIL